jgi:predicted pyridoxine 5'-phosphate oxidase superfamily flavin-nucleotide-binding protein
MSRIEALREELGGGHPGAAKKVKDHLDDYLAGFIKNSPFAVMATSNDTGDCDASPKGGLPGFIKIVDERTLLIPDLGGNRLFQSYENFESNPKAGLIFMIPGMSVTVRVNGQVVVADEATLSTHAIVPEINNADDNANLVQGILLSIDEAYFHCPRAFQFAELWDAKTIAVNGERSLSSLLSA